MSKTTKTMLLAAAPVTFAIIVPWRTYRGRDERDLMV
jgi:hypothetical protein